MRSIGKWKNCEAEREPYLSHKQSSIRLEGQEARAGGSRVLVRVRGEGRKNNLSPSFFFWYNFSHGF